MTILVFVGSLLAAMAIGIPISFALLVCGAALMWHHPDRADLATVPIARGRQRVVVPEQFVSAVDEMNVQSVPPRTTLYERWRLDQPTSAR